MFISSQIDTIRKSYIIFSSLKFQKITFHILQDFFKKLIHECAQGALIQYKIKKNMKCLTRNG